MVEKFDRIYSQELTLLQTVTFGKRTILFETFVGFDRFHKEFFNLKMEKKQCRSKIRTRALI